MNWVGAGTRTYYISVDDLLNQHAYLEGMTGIDSLVTAYIQAACEMVEAYLGYPLTYATATIIATDAKDFIIIPKGATVANIQKLIANEWIDQSWSTVRTDEEKRYSKYSSPEIDGDYKLTVTLSPKVTDKMKHCTRLLVAEMYEQRENKEFKAPMTTVERLLHNEALY